jgi:hypothetical protein
MQRRKENTPKGATLTTTAVRQSNPRWRGRTEEGGAGGRTWPEGGMAAWQPELVPSTAAVLSGAKRSSRGDACRPIITTPAQISARIGRRRWNLLPRRSYPYLLPMYCTMAFVLQSSDSQDLGQIFSWFYISTWSTFFSKVVALGSSYNLGIAILGKYLLDHVLIHAQSACSCTACLRFRT